MKKTILFIALTLLLNTFYSQIAIGEYDVKLQSTATGNGVTDDKTAIQNLVNSAPSGSSIHFPTSTTYSVSGTITVSKILHFYGNNATIYTTNNIPVFTFLSGSEKSKVENFRFWGNSTGTLQCGIYCDGGGIIDINNNTFNSFGGAAIKAKDIENSGELGVNINKNLFQNNAIGIDLKDKAEYAQITNNKFLGNTKSIVSSAGNTLIDGNVMSYGTDAIKITGDGTNSGKGIISNNHVTHNTGNSINIDSVQSGMTVSDNHIIYGTVRIYKCTGVSIIGGLMNSDAYTFTSNTNFRINGVTFPNTLANTLTQTGIAPSMINNYKLNGDNCAYVNAFYSEKNNFTADGTFSVPKGYYIHSIVFENTTANAVTGGIRIGTTNGGTEVVVAQALGANELVEVADANILKTIFSTTTAQTLYIQAVTSWNSANINMYIKLKQL